MSFPAYPSYQDSGVEWLGEVPSHWEVAPLKRLLDIQNGADHKHVEQEDGYPVIGSGGQFTCASDYLFDGESVLLGRKGTIDKPLYVTGRFWTVDTMYWSKIRSETNGRFAFYTATTIPFGYYSTSTALPSMTQSALNGHLIARPPHTEQVAIAAFLDRETAKIDALIEEQRRLIALLKEKRQAVISHAVTKGLDPNAQMKDSGIDWLGDVPTHWNVRRIKHVARMESGHTPDRKVQAYWEDCDIPWVSLHDTGYLKDHDYISETAQMVNALGIANSSARILPPGVVVFSRDATIGRCAITTRPMAVSQHFIAWVCGPALSAEFLLFCLRSMAGELDRLSAGATLKTIGMPDVRTLTIAMPPLSEQHAIVAHARSEAESIDALMVHVTEASRLLQERRAALISAAVTGKIDVRGSAKVLPFPIDRTRARALVGTEIIERSAGQPTFGRVKFQKLAFLAEGHVGISELAGCYTRAAAGPLDGALIDDMERGAHSMAGITVDQAGGTGTAVSYRLGQQRGAHRQELADWLGPDRTAKLDKLIADFAPLNTKQAEAVATLYGVWTTCSVEVARRPMMRSSPASSRTGTRKSARSSAPVSFPSGWAGCVATASCRPAPAPRPRPGGCSYEPCGRSLLGALLHRWSA